MRIEGLARDGEDISELARRMSLSDFSPGEAVASAARIRRAYKIELMRFAVEEEVNMMATANRDPLRSVGSQIAKVGVRRGAVRAGRRRVLRRVL